MNIKKLAEDLEFFLGEYPVNSEDYQTFLLGALLILRSLDASNGNVCNGWDEGSTDMDNYIRYLIKKFENGENIGNLSEQCYVYLRRTDNKDECKPEDYYVAED